MIELSPNAEKLLRCLRYFYNQGYSAEEKEKLKTKPYEFSDQSMYELVKLSIIKEDTNKVSLIQYP